MKPVAERLFTPDSPPRLLAGRGPDGKLVFPLPEGHSGVPFEPHPLGTRGTLWSFTVQRFRPKSPPYIGPIDFAPFAVGYIELPGEIIIESRLVDVEFDRLRVGQPMELTLFDFTVDSSGAPLTTYAFRPVKRETA